MRIVKEDDLGLDRMVPPYRVDVKRPCDVVEDILRIYGYNNVEIPTTLKSSLTIAGEADKEFRRENQVSEQLVGAGFNEILNNSLTKQAYYDENLYNCYPWARTVKVMNPLSSDLGVMRQTLLFGGLESIVRNVNRKARNLRFFEVGNVYHFDEERYTTESPIKAYQQRYHLALWVTGHRVEGNWAHPDEESSFFELKAHVENVLRRVGLQAGQVVTEASDNNIFDKGLRMKTRGGKVLVDMGIVNHHVLRRFDIEQPVYYAEIDWTELMKATRKNSLLFQELSKYPDRKSVV